MNRLNQIRERARSSLWTAPAFCVLAAAAASLALLTLDRRYTDLGEAWYAFGGSADGARTMLSTTSSSMLTFMALVFSITIVALQLASGQLSPRVQRTFLRDRLSKWTLGVFIGTFTYSILVLRSVRSEGPDGGDFVPAVSVAVAVLFVLVSIGFFVKYIDHIAHSIRAISVIRNVAGETKHRIERLYPEAIGDEPDEAPAEVPRGNAHLVEAATAGVLVAVDGDKLLEATRKHDVVVEVPVLVGDFVPRTATIVRIWGGRARDAESDVLSAVELGDERTMHQDAAYGFRQLVDIADRALSRGINDPTTAVQALDAIHDLLRALVRRRFPARVRADEHGNVRVIARSPTWEDILALALDEIRRSGNDSIQIVRRLRALLEDLASVAPPRRLPPILKQLEMVERVADRFDGYDRTRAMRPSAQGNL